MEGMTNPFLVPEFVEDNSLIPIVEKILLGERLTFEDGIKLFKTNDILTLGKLADFVNKKKNGNLVYFVVNRHINLTNLCIGNCKFCAFRRSKSDADSYELTIDEVLKKIESFKGISEIHIVSGLHPEWSYDYYIELLREIKKNFPYVHIQAFTAEEIDHLCRISGKDTEEVFCDLIEAGLGSLPGGGAEIFSEEIRKKLCPEKLSSDRYLEIHKIAHKFGLKTNASILYGHIETYEDRVKHLLRLRELQDETGGFQAFISFAYHPKNTKLGGNFTTGFDDLKMLSVARVLLDNFPHIRAFWIMLGEKLAQISLHFGVDDLDGTVIEESITHSAGANTGSFMPKERLIKLIKESGKIPVERDTNYNVIKVYD
ncbi:putative menaquinone biosynthesis protein [Desulfurobacterium thermolithotrophum DSM 11699]|uniref:Aminodeoxyfutalosine synthase n=1 Tax=Desulfurobacterium thermolithotrophum (strain DSM 11699 / BSA) TaxID=868864 RepID=F0S1R2_DESTD|nr:aminofutalosine synthase MqnE [Desulfurobacterium thermolithotrophum]ADY72917.1 putative menaquinone biosynthesis protein [Desulfurobacterium thermolithotrophum DSM 11699]